MRLQLASDLHLEFLAHHFPGEPTIGAAPEADILVLAGDISTGTKAIEIFRNWPVPVIYLLGNHEGYGNCWKELFAQCVITAQGTAITVLEKGGVCFGDTRILGCTLWTDYCLYSHERQAELMGCADRRLNDHRLIRNADGTRFSTADALAEHEHARGWLATEIAKPFSGKTVVATHHAPHPFSVHSRYLGDALNGAFASDLTELMSDVDVWVHGHVHDSFEYSVKDCRVFANPRGYPMNLGTANSTEELVFENSSFRGNLVIDV